MLCGVKVFVKIRSRMGASYKLKVSWELIRAHLCTVAVSVGFQATWRSPRDAFRYGGFQYALVFTAAMVGIALPLTLLQLAIGQLSQQDPVGVWRAVPFFKGVGYLRLLISFLVAVYSVIYVALTISYFLYALSNSLPFWDCIDLVFDDEEYIGSYNASECLQETFMAPLTVKPEYYIAVALIVLILWIIFPFVFYNPVKLMKRVLYVLGPLVITLAITIVSCVGLRENLTQFIQKSDWTSFTEPNIWYAAIVQALLSSQVASGYLISAGDNIYSNTNVKWTAIIFVIINILSTWAGLLFWYSVSGDEKEKNVFAVLLQAYKLGENPDVDFSWAVILIIFIALSGFITLLTALFPIYDRCRRIGGARWRVVSTTGSLIAAAVSTGILAVRQPGLTMLDEFAVPLLICITTILETSAFVFIYGWKILVEDIEFLTGGKLSKFWVSGWCSGPGIIVPFIIWWFIEVYDRCDKWLEPPWVIISVISTIVVAVIVFLVLSIFSVARQVQYDFIGKLKSSFRSSRHWGPRDPITHYYWLASREELDRTTIGRLRYQRRQLGQMSGRPSFLTISDTVSRNDNNIEMEKTRSHSDDWLYTVNRKQLVSADGNFIAMRKRAKSLDWEFNNKPMETTDSINIKFTRFSMPTYEMITERNNNLTDKITNRF